MIMGIGLVPNNAAEVTAANINQSSFDNRATI